MTTILGIDPGLSGGWCVLRGSRVIACDRLPTYSIRVGTRRLNMVDAGALVSSVAHHGITVVGIEEAHGRKGDGSSGLFTFGGVWWSLVGAFRFHGTQPLVIVHAKEWQKAILKPFRGQVSTYHTSGQRRTPREISKASSVLMAKTLYPEVDLQPGLCTTPQDGLSDAIGIALYVQSLINPVSIKDHPPRTIKRQRRRRA